MGDLEPKCPTCGALLNSRSWKCSACGQDVACLAPTQVDTPPQLPTEAAESRIGEFRILRTIGRGGMGTVYEAYQESMHRRVALKVLNAESPLSSNEVLRFEREAWIGGRLSHPNIVRVYSQGTAGAVRYIAMELVDGESLASAIQEARRRRPAQSLSDSNSRSSHIRNTVSMFVDVADALQHVHEHGIVHRDIKPLNLLLAKDKFRLLLTDFGLARDAEAMGVTRVGDFMGTVRYMSPEQLLAHRVSVDCRTDIWSLGISLYEAVTLDLPYSGDSEAAYIAAVSMTEPASARTRDRTVPRELETVLMKCLQRNPEQRYATARELKDDLVRFLEDRPVLARRPGVLLKTARLAWRHRLVVGAVAIAAALVLAIVGALVTRARRRAEMERIRWTLQQVINNPKAEPESLQPDWGNLRVILQKEVRRDPHGDVALLAQRAACRASVDVPSFGLVSDLPDLFLGANAGVDPGKDFLNILSFEGALDDGPWEPIISVSFQQKDESGGATNGDTLDKIFPVAKLTPTPHQVKLRVTFRLFEAEKLSSEAREELEKSRFVPGAFEKAWPAVRNSAPLFTETRALDPVSITLSTTYPDDFPRKVFASQVTEPPQKWSHLDRVRIVRVRLPAGSAPGFALRWPSVKGPGTGSSSSSASTNKTSYCSSPNLTGLTSPVVSIEFFGRLEPAVPIAADATISSDHDLKPLLSFPVIWSDGQLRRVPTAARIMSDSDDDDRTWPYNRMDFPNGKRTLPRLPDGIMDGMTTGRIDFVPSRSVALTLKGLDHYFGDQLSVPVASLEVVTVPGEWVQTEGCR